MVFSDYISRFRIRSRFLRFVSIVLALVISFEFYAFKDFFDRAFIAVGGGAILSFVVQVSLISIAGLLLFLALFFFEAIFMTSDRSEEQSMKRTKKEKTKTNSLKTRQKSSRR